MRIDTYPASDADIAERVNELQMLVDVLPVGIAIAHDAACNHVTGNAHFLQMFGLAPGINVSFSAPTGKRLTGFLAVRDGAEMSPDELPLQVAAREGREVRDQVIQLLRSDGVTVVLLGSAVPLFDAAGRAQGAIGAFFDIDDRLPSPAERERLRVELRARVEAPVAELAGANKARLAQALAPAEQANALSDLAAGPDQADWLDLTHDAIVVHDLNGQIQSWNRGAEERYGWTAGEACGQNAPSLLDTQFPIPRSEILSQLLTTGRWEGELVQTRRDGTRLTMASRWALRRDERHEPEAVLEINSDITDQKRAEESLRESREDLQTLARRLVELQEQERKQLAHGLHDDAGQLLASLSVGLRVLEKRYGASPAARAHIVYLQEMADEVQTSVHQLGAALRPVSLDKLGLLPALRQYAAQFASEHGVMATVSEAGSAGSRLPGEIEIALYRIVCAALSNASHRSRLSRVDVIIQRRPGSVLAIIEDDGIAIDSDEARRHDRLAVLDMRQRAEMLNGSLSIEGGPPADAGSVTVYAEVPFRERPV